jgi:hypothetical protein
MFLVVRTLLIAKASPAVTTIVVAILPNNAHGCYMRECPLQFFFFNEYSGQILKNPARSNQNNNQRTFFFFAEEIHERKYFLGKLL